MDRLAIGMVIAVLAVVLGAPGLKPPPPPRLAGVPPVGPEVPQAWVAQALAEMPFVLPPGSR